jgi:hypothetical protein
MPPRRKSPDPNPTLPLDVASPREAAAAPRRFQSFSELSAFIFRVADLLRGPYQPSEYRHVLIPMTVLRRLDCVLAPTRAEVYALYQSHYLSLRRRQNAEAEAEQATLDELNDLTFFNKTNLDLAGARTGKGGSDSRGHCPEAGAAYRPAESAPGECSTTRRADRR